MSTRKVMRKKRALENCCNQVFCTSHKVYVKISVKDRLRTATTACQLCSLKLVPIVLYHRAIIFDFLRAKRRQIHRDLSGSISELPNTTASHLRSGRFMSDFSAP